MMFAGGDPIVRSKMDPAWAVIAATIAGDAPLGQPRGI